MMMHDDDDDDDLLNNKCPVGWVEQMDAYSLVAGERCVTNLKVHVFLQSIVSHVY